jgi:hypothetical protein
MKTNIIFMVSAVLLTSCRYFPDPVVTTTESFTLQSNVFNQKGFAGNYLPDSIIITLTNNLYNSPLDRYTVAFRITQGGGETDDDRVTTNLSGKAATRWKLGAAANDQQMEIILYDRNGKKLTNLLLQAYAFIPGAWNTTFAYPDQGITDMAADTFDQVTLAVSQGKLFSQGSRYFDWLPVTSLPGYANAIEIGRDRTFYCSTWSGELYKSIDQGFSWIKCAQPWTDYGNLFEFKLTADDYIWATAAGQPLRCSHNGGATWITDSTGLPNTEQLGDIFRLSDGTLFLQTLNTNIYKSVNDGHSWTKVLAPPYSLKIFVTSNDEIILFNQDNGISIYKSTDEGASFTLKFAVMPDFGTQMNHTVHQHGKDFYLLIPGYGILHTLDFESFTTYWRNYTVNDLFMDDEGTLMAREFPGGLVSYRQPGNK